MAPANEDTAPAPVAENEDIELELLRPDDRRSCPQCGSYQVRILQGGKLGEFTYGVICRAPHGCNPRTQWVKDTTAARRAPYQAQRREWERLKQLCLAKRWSIRWAIGQYQEMFGTTPEWT